ELARGGVAQLRAGGHREIEIRARPALHVLALAVLPPLGLPVGPIAVVEQRREVRVGAHVHAAARPAVASVGTAFGDELFTAKGGGAGAAWARGDVDDRTIYEHCGLRIADCGLARAAPRPIPAVGICADVTA